MRNLRSVSVCCALFLSFSACLYSQAVSGTVLGNVTDTSGAVVAHAAVTLTEVKTNVARTAATNESGNYTFPDVPEGSYSVTVAIPGFKKEIRDNIIVAVNTSARVDVQLQPGNISQSVEVTAAPPALQTDRADVETSIQPVETANLPVSGQRNFQSLLNLVPGTTRANFQHSQFFNATSSLQTEVNGQLRMGNNYQIEGIDDNERTGLLQIIVPPLEAIQTVDVSTSNFEAELGRASGAVTNVILKSGTNQIHGSGYEFFQNSDLNSRLFFNPKVGHLAYNYFGGNIGGPIIKNKLFYFGDFLEVKDQEANSNLVTIPTQAEILGNLSGSTTTIYNPFTGNANGTGRTAFPGNVIPPSLINPVSAKLLSLIPAPNVASATGVNNYFALLPYHKDTPSYDVKVDYNPSDKDRVSVRLSYARPSLYQAAIFGADAGGPGGASANFEGTGLQRTYSGGINYDHVFSATLINELRFGVAYYNNISTPADYGSSDTANVGIPGVNVNQFTSGIVGIAFTNGSFFNPSSSSTPLIGYAASMPWTRSESNSDLVDTATKIIGNHTLKFGVDYRQIRDALLQGQSFSPRGLYTFATGQTALNTGGTQSATSPYNLVASLLLDVPNQAGRDLNTYFPALRGWQLFTFAQDKWVVSPKLTLDLGIRYELYPAYHPQFPLGFSNYNPVTNQLQVAGLGPNSLSDNVQTDYKYFAPRFGVAYRVTNKTVLRAGFGISYTPFPDINYAFNYPVRSNVSYNPAVATYGPAVLPNGQTATFQNGFPTALSPAVPADGLLTAPTAQSYYVVNPNFKNPYVESWNVALQQELPGKFTFTGSYVANHGVDTVTQFNLNAATVAGLGNAGLPEYASFGRTASTTLLFGPYSSMYNSLQVKLDRRFSNGFNLTTAYTYGKGMGYQSGDDSGLDFYINQRRNYARNDYDRTHTFVQSYVYDLPFGPGKHWLNSGFIGNVFGNWRVSGIVTWMSGLPMTLSPSTNNLNAPGNTQTVNQVAPVQILGGVGPNNPWFSGSSFAAPTQNGVFGNTGRNFLTGPNFFNLDASLFKLITYKERYTLELRGEAYSLTNTPQFANPGTSLGSSNFGYITSTLGASSGGNASFGRSFQLGAKFNF